MSNEEISIWASVYATSFAKQVGEGKHPADAGLLATIHAKSAIEELRKHGGAPVRPKLQPPWLTGER